jgi:hypothetical protein
MWPIGLFFPLADHLGYLFSPVALILQFPDPVLLEIRSYLCQDEVDFFI